jgi:flagellar protein FliT
MPKTIYKFFFKKPKVPRAPAVNPDKQYSDHDYEFISGRHMTSTEVLSMYENIAGLTSKMVVAAQVNDWHCLDRLENQCAAQSVGVLGGVPALEGNARQRKIDLLKQIMANDRAIRDVTEPWMGRLNG